MKPQDITADYECGSGWGNSIRWWPDGMQFVDRPLAHGEVYRVMGFKRSRPKVGDTLLDEFENSWVLFKFVEVKLCDDPKDMFFANVTPIRQVMKADEVEEVRR